MRIIIFYLVIINSVTWADSSVLTQTTSLLQNQFRSVVKLPTGSFTRDSGPESCLEGHLRILDFTNYLNLELGSHILIEHIEHIGRSSAIVHDKLGNCDYAYTSSYSTSPQGKVVLYSREVQTCPGTANQTYEVKAELQGSSLRYVRHFTEGTNLPSTEDCQLSIHSSSQPKKTSP